MKTNRKHIAPTTRGCVLLIFFLGVLLIPMGKTSSASSQAAPETLAAYVYPNPARINDTPILFVKAQKAEKISAYVFDTAGGLVREIPLEQTDQDASKQFQIFKKNLSTNLFRPGVYNGMVMVFSNGGEVQKTDFHFMVIK